MTLTFYHAPYSTANLTDAVLKALKVPHDVKIVDLKAGGTKEPDFLKINPNGKV
jgi:glutathione S-transferase